MKVQVKNLPNCAREIHVEVTADKVQTELDALYSRISQEAKVDGFRKGKAPIPLIKQRFKDTVKREMADEILPKFLKEVLDNQKIQPISKPRIKDYQFEEGSSLHFTATVEVRPEFDLKNYKGIKVKKEAVEVNDGDVDMAIEQLRDRAAQFIPIGERPVEKNDLAIVDFEGRLGGVPFEGGKATHYPIFVGSGNMIPGFEHALIGLPKGETKHFPLKFPEDYPKKELAGKEVEFVVTVQEIKEKKIPAVDDDFAKSILGSDSVVQMREKIHAQLKNDREMQQRDKMLDQVMEKLIKDHKFDVPESWVVMETIQLIRNGIQHMRQHGVDPNNWSEEQKKEFNNKMRQQAERNVRIAILADHIAEVEKIECEGKDWEAYVVKIAANSNQTHEAVKQYIKQQGNQENLKERIRHEKTLDFLLDIAHIEAK